MLLRLLNLLLLLLPLGLLAEEVTNNLQISDIHKEMEQIFRVHLTQKKMTPQILRLAIGNFINQFDPHHVYLLAHDVAPFLGMSDSALLAEVDNFNKDDYSLFEKLNRAIQKATVKMRKFRRSMVVNEERMRQLGKETLPQLAENAMTQLNSFAKDDNQLDAWHTIYMANLVMAELENLKMLHRTLTFSEAVRNIELLIEEHEDDYLYEDRQGKPLPQVKQESLFALHTIQALTRSVDVHSQFLNAQQARALRMNLEKEYVGLGIGFQELGNAFAVSQIIKGSSAEQNGKIQIGDEIVAIDSHKVEGLPPDEVLTNLQGPEGTMVTLTMKNKDNGVYKVSLMRKHIILQEGRVDTRFQEVPGGILAFVKLHGFYQGAGGITSEQDMRTALESLKKKGPIKALVLDLRDNPGGFLLQAVKVAGLFIKTGVIVVAKDANGNLHHFRDLDPDDLYAGPLVLLTSKGTASAAEIVAEALKDYGVAVIVGDPETYGKGSIQSTTMRDDNQANSLHVTVGRYYSVSGKSVQLEGVKADIVVPGTLSQSKVGEEYLSGTLTHDSIAPSFIDTLSDIQNIEKPWYKHYYRPYVQEPTDKYRKWVPELAKLSEERLKKNTNYQNLTHGKLEIKEGDKTVTLTPEEAKKALSDMQEQEATNIALDLMRLSGSR